MSSCPPKKKLRQSTLDTMLSKQQVKGTTLCKSECESSTPIFTNLEVGLMRINSTSSESSKEDMSTKSPEPQVKENSPAKLKVHKPDGRKNLSKKSPKKSPKKNDANNIVQLAEETMLRIEQAKERRQQREATVSPSTSFSDDSTPVQSPDMFEDHDEAGVTAEDDDINKEKISWRCTHLNNLRRWNSNNSTTTTPPISIASDHTVLIKLPITIGVAPKPHPTNCRDIWDSYHVKLPYSSQSLMVCPNGTKGKQLVQRWKVITNVLQRNIDNVDDLERSICVYNERYADKWKFQGLRKLLEQEFSAGERDYFFRVVLPGIVRLALSLPDVLTGPIPLLTQRNNHSVTLSQLQIASLLANAFFCTFPRRNAKGNNTEYSHYPDINFNRLFYHIVPRSMEKLKCIINYFRIVSATEPVGVVTFTRSYISSSDLPNIRTSTKPLPQLHIDTLGLIEESKGFLQVDFANKYLGGGVLGMGCVQEEIRFVLCPELLVTRLFTEALNHSEALIITGVEQYSNGSGYASTFKWTSSHKDMTPHDQWGRRMCQVVAIDALHFVKNPTEQYLPKPINREIIKLYAGYKQLDNSDVPSIAVATGNWGCGAFRGDPRLKALLQLAVCGFVERDVAYFTFGDRKLRDDITTMYHFLMDNKVTVGELVKVLLQYHHSKKVVDGNDLLHFVYHILSRYDSETDHSDAPQSENEFKLEKTHYGASKVLIEDGNKKSKTITDYFHRVPSEKEKLIQMESEPSSSTRQIIKQCRDPYLTEEKIHDALADCENLVKTKWMKSEAKCSNNVGSSDKNVDNLASCSTVTLDRDSDIMSTYFSDHKTKEEIKVLDKELTKDGQEQDKSIANNIPETKGKNSDIEAQEYKGSKLLTELDKLDKGPT